MNTLERQYLYNNRTGNRSVYKLFTMNQREDAKIRRELKIEQNKVLMMEADLKQDKKNELNAAKWIEFDKVKRTKNPNTGMKMFYVQSRPSTPEEVKLYREFRESLKETNRKKDLLLVKQRQEKNKADERTIPVSKGSKKDATK